MDCGPTWPMGTYTVFSEVTDSAFAQLDNSRQMPAHHTAQQTTSQNHAATTEIAPNVRKRWRATARCENSKYMLCPPGGRTRSGSVMSPEWHNGFAVTHPDEIPILDKWSRWLKDHAIRMRYHQVLSILDHLWFKFRCAILIRVAFYVSRIKFCVSHRQWGGILAGTQSTQYQSYPMAYVNYVPGLNPILMTLQLYMKLHRASHASCLVHQRWIHSNIQTE